MLHLSTTLSFYKRQDIQTEILEAARDREIAVRFGDRGFGKRPDMLSYPSDILELAKRGSTSFHCSEERWRNPLEINTGMKKAETEELRIGWDLVLDIDCPHFPYSKIAADLIVKALRHHNIKSVSVKFSGNKGFHIGVPFESFPEVIMGEETSKKFPDATRLVALYIKKMVEYHFTKKVMEMEKGDINKIAKNIKKEIKDITYGEGVKKLDLDKILDIDTVLISSRHLFRMPYSMHEKSGLVSVPVDPEKVMEFERDHATPDKIKSLTQFRFLDRDNAIAGEAKELFDKATAMGVNAMEREKFERRDEKEFEIPEEAIPKEFFPPSINNILKGMKDGKKRALFLLVNFLTCIGWEYDDIEKILHEWNEKNEEPLRETLITGQIRYHKMHKKKVLPPNYSNKAYYYDLGILSEEEKNSKFNNPVSLAKHKLAMHTRYGGKKKKDESDASKPQNSEESQKKT